MGWQSWWHAVVAFVAAFAAGIANAIAGGGTNISFPTLLWLGLSPVDANATSAVALWPGYASASWGFWREIKASPHRWYWLAIPSLIGGGIGAYLLVHTPSTVFRSIAPFLVIGSSALIAVEPALAKRLGTHGDGKRSRGWLALAIAVQLVIATYGGYFGAGLGILILTALGLLGLSDIHKANGMKSIYSVAIKGVAVVYFIGASKVVWHAAIVMAIGAIAGGYVGAAVGRKVKERAMRWVVVSIGVAMGIVMLVRIM